MTVWRRAAHSPFRFGLARLAGSAYARRVTHEYTILVGGVVLGGANAPEPATAVAWALGTVLAVGSDARVFAISRGDSHVANLNGALLVPASGVRTIEPGDPADLDILDPATRVRIAEIRGGRLTSGVLSGVDAS